MGDMTPRTLTPEERREIVRQVQGGLPRKAIAAMHGVTVRTIWNVCNPDRERKVGPVNEAGFRPEKPDDDPSNPPQWRCKCGRLVIGTVTCECGKMARWAKQDAAARQQAIALAREEGWIP